MGEVVPGAGMHLSKDTLQGFKLRELGSVDYLVPGREALKQVLFVPLRVLVFLLVAVASIILLVLFLALVFAPEIFLPAAPGPF